MLVDPQEESWLNRTNARDRTAIRCEDVVAQNPEDNQAQASSDAAPDASTAADANTDPGEDRSNTSDRADGRGSDANGVPAFDEADGEARRKLYQKGAVTGEPDRLRIRQLCVSAGAEALRGYLVAT